MNLRLTQNFNPQGALLNNNNNNKLGILNVSYF